MERRREGSTRVRDRFEPHEIRPGGSTAAGGVVDYRLRKVAAVAPIRGRWLDCGSCDGEYAAGLLAHGATSVVGTDVDPERVAGSQARYRHLDRLEFVTAAGEELPFPDAHFDGVLLNEVLEHVRDQRQTLTELARVLAPGGVLAVFSPNRWFPFEGHGMAVGSFNIGGPVPLLPWLPRRVAQTVMKARNYWPGELRDLVAGAGLIVDRVDFAFPLFGHYPWMPKSWIRRYLSNLDRVERLRLIRRFGVSTLVVAHR